VLAPVVFVATVKIFLEHHAARPMTADIILKFTLECYGSRFLASGSVLIVTAALSMDTLCCSISDFQQASSDASRGIPGGRRQRYSSRSATILPALPEQRPHEVELMGRGKLIGVYLYVVIFEVTCHEAQRIDLMCIRAHGHLYMVRPRTLFCDASYGSSQVRAIHDISGENVFLCASRRTCLNPECPAVKESLIAAMKKRDEGGDAMVLGKRRKGGDDVDTAGDDVKAALRRGDAGKCMWATKKLIGAGVSFTISDAK